MTIGTSNQTQLSYIKEVTAGTTPDTPVMQILRMTGETLIANNSTTQSEEIRSDRATSDLLLTDQSNTGTISGEISGSTYDEFLQSALYSTDWTAVDDTDVTYAATATGFTDSNSAFITLTLEVGQFIYISGFTDSTIDGYYRITTLAAGAIDTYPVPPATETAGASVTIKAATIKSGTTDSSYTIQKEFLDLGTVSYQNFRGCRVSTLGIELNVGSIANISFGILGLTSESTETQIAGLTQTAATTTAVMNAVSDVTNITAVGTGITSTLFFTQLSLSYDNALRELKAVGNLGSIDVRPGTIVANATINPYFENIELLEAFLANQSFTLTWQMTSSDSYVYIFSLPNVKFTSQTLSAGSKDQDMIITGAVQAILDPTSLTTMRIDRFTP